MVKYFFNVASSTDMVKIPRAVLERLTDTLGYAA
jgi:hypothetical protein